MKIPLSNFITFHSCSCLLNKLKIKFLPSWWIDFTTKHSLVYQDSLLVVLILLPCFSLTLYSRSGFRWENCSYPDNLFLNSYLSQQPSNERQKIIAELDYLAVTKHQVKRGEDIWKIAREYGTTVDSIRSTNYLSSTFLRPGETVLLVHNKRGLIYRVKERDTLEQIATQYECPRTEIIITNDLSPFTNLSPGTLLFIPNAVIKFPEFIWPCNGKLSSRYGRRLHPVFGEKAFHEGIDISGPYRQPIRAAREGRVIFAGWKSGYGKTILIKHPGGYITCCGHLSSVNVSFNQRIDKGEIIGRLGSSGRSTGPHLHFELRKQIRHNARPINPLRYLSS